MNIKNCRGFVASVLLVLVLPILTLGCGADKKGVAIEYLNEEVMLMVNRVWNDICYMKMTVSMSGT